MKFASEGIVFDEKWNLVDFFTRKKWWERSNDASHEMKQWFKDL